MLFSMLTSLFSETLTRFRHPEGFEWKKKWIKCKKSESEITRKDVLRVLKFSWGTTGQKKISVRENWLVKNPPPPNLTSMKLLTTFSYTAWKHLPGKLTGTERLKPSLFPSAAAYELNAETPQTHSNLSAWEEYRMRWALLSCLDK